MARLILVIGESGSGKSTSLRNLDSKETAITQVVDKPLPFKGWRSLYNSENKNLATIKTDNAIERYSKITRALHFLSAKECIKNIVIDDSQYLMGLEFMSRSMEKGYEKFTDMGKKFCDLIVYAGNILRDDQNLIFLHHSDKKEGGRISIKTVGRMLDDKISLEGLFSYVIHAFVSDDKYFFLTNTQGDLLAKTPLGMFNDLMIDNDMKIVLDAIEEYEK